MTVPPAALAPPAAALAGAVLAGAVLAGEAALLLPLLQAAVSRATATAPPTPAASRAEPGTRLILVGLVVNRLIVFASRRRG